MFVRSSVKDIKTLRAQMNDPFLHNWILEPGDENQRSRGEKWEKRRERGLEEEGREGGWGPLFYSCLEDMANMRLPNPTGNREPRGKGKTNKGNGMVGGEWGEDLGNQRGRSEQSSGFVCQEVFYGGSSHISAFRELNKSLHEICFLVEHFKGRAIFD